MGKQLLAVFVISAWALSASAAELAVPKDYPAIQLAIDAASAGDTVLVSPGTYTESLRFKTGITLKGTSRRDVIVEADGAAAPLLIAENCSSGSIESITFRQTGSTSLPPGQPGVDAVLISDSTVELSDCDASYSSGSGFAFQGVNKSTIRSCSSHDNRVHGISAKSGDCDLTIENNACVCNGEIGINADQPKTHLSMHGNACILNRFSGIYMERRTTYDSKNNLTLFNGHPAEIEVQNLFWQNRYVELELIAERLRSQKARYVNGEWQLRYFYQFITNRVDDYGETAITEFMNSIHQWQRQFPDSITWRVALVDFFKSRASTLSGSGDANGVSDDAWQAYIDNYQNAWAILRDAERCPRKDPEYYFRLCTMNLEMPNNALNVPIQIIRRLTSLPIKTDAEKSFDAGIKLEPLYLPLYRERVRQLLPRWGGSAKQIEKLAENVADKLGPGDGDCLYTTIAIEVLEQEGQDQFLDAYSFSWERMQKGFERSLTMFPESDNLRQSYAQMASIERDQKVAARVFTAIRQYEDWGVFHSEHEFGLFKKWAVENTAYPEISPLETAVNDDNALKIKELLAGGDDANSLSRSGLPLLEICVSRQNWDSAFALVEAGANPNIADESGSPILFSTLGEPSGRALDVLLQNNADPNLCDPMGWSPMAVAIKWDRPQLVPLMLEHGANPNTPCVAPPLYMATRKGFTDVVKMLLEHKADPNGKPDGQPCPLSYAVEMQHQEIFSALLASGADVNLEGKDGWTPIFAAADVGNVEMAKTLIEHGADIHKQQDDGWTPFHMAAMKNHVQMLQYLFSVEPEGFHALTENKYTLLHTAAKNGHVEVVTFLIEKGMDVNAKAKGGETPLTLAEDKKKQDVVALLREHGAQ